MVEQLTVNEKVAGSNPAVGAIHTCRLMVGRFALDEEIGVRIPTCIPGFTAN